MNEITRLFDQRVASLEHDARQPRLTMVKDGQANIKTRERTESGTTAVQAMHGDSVLPTGLIPTRCILPASGMTAPDLRHSLVQGRMPW